MAPLSFHVNIGPWSADGYGPYVDDVHVDDPDPALIRLVGSAHAAGVVEIVGANAEQLRAAATAHVQSQADGEAAYAEAQADGRWQEGNLAQFELEQSQAGSHAVDMVVDVAAAEESA